MPAHPRHMIRPPAVAGLFYPDEASELRRQVDDFLAATPQASPPAPKAVISPHAGYVYSGQTAAHAFRALSVRSRPPSRVVLIGPCHRVALAGIALPSAQAFATPLGEIELDRKAIEALVDIPEVSINDTAHAQEHSLEVQLPFLQALFGDNFRLIPIAVGDTTTEAVAQVLEKVWGDDETLIVVSSDLSHYHSYKTAQAMDTGTVARILASLPIEYGDACGALPINALLALTRRKTLRPRLLDMRNSGDTAGDKTRVVGYAAFGFDEVQR